jgi:hypothetical protein
MTDVADPPVAKRPRQLAELLGPAPVVVGLFHIDEIAPGKYRLTPVPSHVGDLGPGGGSGSVKNSVDDAQQTHLKDLANDGPAGPVPGNNAQCPAQPDSDMEDEKVAVVSLPSSDEGSECYDGDTLPMGP